MIFKHTWEAHQDDDILYYKNDKFQRLEIIQSMFSDHSEIKLETRNKEI